jgi:hypothetical protein
MKFYQLSFIFCILIGCKSLNISNKEQFAREKFDTVKFNKHKVANIATYLRDDGAKITQSDIGKFYSEEIKIKPDKPFAWRYTFFRESLKLRSAAEFFYGSPIGKYHEYNELGVLTKEIDNDAPYHFSLGAVISKIKRDYNIDILKLQKGMSMNRYIDEVTKEPEYTIGIPISEMALRYIIIDGNSGNVKRDFISQMIE